MRLTTRLSAWLLLSISIALPSAAQGQADPDETKAVPKIAQPATQNARFVIVFSPHLREDTYLLDTLTGRVWKQVRDRAGGMVWEEMEHLDFNALSSPSSRGEPVASDELPPPPGLTEVEQQRWQLMSPEERTEYLRTSLIILNVRTRQVASGVTVEGDIEKNGLSDVADIPRLRVSLLNRANKEIEFKIVDPPQKSLRRGEPAHFTVRFDRPKDGVVSATAAFVSP